jgi:hypothetical protein
MPSFDFSWTWENKALEIQWLLHAMEVLSGPGAVTRRILKVVKVSLPPTNLNLPGLFFG